MNLQSLLDYPQVQLSTKTPRYSAMPIRANSSVTKDNDNSVSYLHHFVLMMAVCNTAVVSAISHHETHKNDPFTPHFGKTDAVDANGTSPSEQQQQRTVEAPERKGKHNV